MSGFSFAGGFKPSREEERPIDNNMKKETERVVEKVDEEDDIDEEYSEVIEDTDQQTVKPGKPEPVRAQEPTNATRQITSEA